ncbi:MAG: NADH-quinone oxidoreductase subunit NuoN [Gammaproteobacteria bacterium]|nr:MAG: NADH-quinone oxidoreductase subunit NuoN [Gammaproteobacteria bacterium]
MNTMNLSLALPEIFVASMASLILVIDLFLSTRQRIFIYFLAQVTLIGAAVLTVQGMTSNSVTVFSGMFVHDAMSDILKLAIYLIVFVVFAYSRDYIRERNMFRGEFFVLALFAMTGMMVVISAAHLLSLYMGLELLSLCLYAMVALQRDSGKATEAAMKYFVLGAIASGLLLYGMSMLYGVTGDLSIVAVKQKIAAMSPDDIILIFGLVFIVAALAFKLGVVPFHMWVPDVYHGAPTAVALFISTAPKIAGFAIFMRLLVGGLIDMSPSWQDMLIVLAILSMGIGNVVAIAQTNIKRMLAYSGIAHMGFFLLGILSISKTGYTASMFYILVYALMTLGAFGMVILMSRHGFEAENIEDFKGLNQRNSWYALLMLLLMISMAGVPPTLGFYAKLMVIQSVIDASMVWLAVVSVLFAVIGAFYYLRIIKLMYFDDAEDHSPIHASMDMRILISFNAVILVAAVLYKPFIDSFLGICRIAIAGLS